MVDIHCHIVPGVDDGASDVEMSLAMIEAARRQGVSRILTTPHIRGSRSELPVHQKHKEKFAGLLERAEGMGLHLGCEIRVTTESTDTIEEPAFTANEGGKYVLLEMPYDSVPPYLGRLLFDYRLSGITPIIAHPERNVEVLRKPELALGFVEQGALLQITNGALLGEMGEQMQSFSQTLVMTGLVSFTSSDAHNLTSRTFDNWKATQDLLLEMAAEAQSQGQMLAVQDLVHTNGEAVCVNRPLSDLQLEPDSRGSRLKALSEYDKRPKMKRKRFFFF